MKLFSEGAEAKMYAMHLLDDDVLVKEREQKRYRVERLDLEIRILRTKKEARILYRASKLGVRVPRVISVGKFSVYMERLDGVLLRDAKPNAKAFEELGRMLGALHNGGIVHGDFTPANVMLCGGKIYLIDFGLADMSNSIEDKALDLLLMKRSVGKDLYEALERTYSLVCKNHTAVLGRLAEIEKRGRYQVRTLM